MVIISFQKCDSSAQGIIEDVQPAGFYCLSFFLSFFLLFFIRALRDFTAVSMRIDQA
jgi:hypothetical protein